MKEKLQQLAYWADRAKARVVGAAVVAAAPVLSFAQAVDPFDSTKDAIITKVTTYGGGLVLVAAAGVVFMVGVKYVKKIARAA